MSHWQPHTVAKATTETSEHLLGDLWCGCILVPTLEMMLGFGKLSDLLQVDSGGDRWGLSQAEDTVTSVSRLLIFFSVSTDAPGNLLAPVLWNIS